MPLQCHKCGHFIGKDGYPDVFYDDYSGGYEEGYSLCGPCGRKDGRPDLRQNDQSQFSREAT
jgi:hypothetical protein